MVELDGSRWQSHADRLVRAEEFLPRIDEILSRLPELRPEDDESLEQFLALEKSPVEAKHLARSWVESYDAADPDRVSVRFLVRERRAEQQIDGDRCFGW